MAPTATHEVKAAATHQRAEPFLRPASHRKSFVPDTPAARPITASAPSRNPAPWIPLRPVEAGLQNLDRVTARHKAGEALRPDRQDRQRHSDSADHDHREENALAKRLNRGHAVRQRRDQQADAQKGGGHKEKCHRGRSRMTGKRGAKNGPGQGDLNQDGGGDNQHSRQHRAEDQPRNRDRQQAVTSPDALFALGDQRGRQSETRAAEYRDGDDLAHLSQQRRRAGPKHATEREKKDDGHQIPVHDRLRVAEIQMDREQEMPDPSVPCSGAPS